MNTEQLEIREDSTNWQRQLKKEDTAILTMRLCDELRRSDYHAMKLISHS